MPDCPLAQAPKPAGRACNFAHYLGSQAPPFARHVARLSLRAFLISPTPLAPKLVEAAHNFELCSLQLSALQQPHSNNNIAASHEPSYL